MSSTPVAQVARPVPVRTILTTLGLVVATAVALLLLYDVRQALVWISVAVFFTIALYAPTNWVQRHVTRSHRTLATVTVFLVVLVVVVSLVSLFAVPLVSEIANLSTQLPQLIREARAGHGPVGGLLERAHVLSYLQGHQSRISNYIAGLGTSAAGVLSGVATGFAGTITVFVLSLLMVLESPRMIASTLNLIDDPQRRERVRRVGGDCAKSITGYVAGNLLISVICGVLTYLTLLITGVPFAGLIALFVAVTDVIPLIGATLGAVAALIAAAVHSVPALIVVAIFFLAYQQLENHVLQPLILARTVKLNPLTVLIAILLGVELGGILGALLAIPVAGIIQVILRDLWDHRRGTTKTQPTTGEDRAPVPHLTSVS